MFFSVQNISNEEFIEYFLTQVYKKAYVVTDKSWI